MKRLFYVYPEDFEEGQPYRVVCYADSQAEAIQLCEKKFAENQLPLWVGEAVVTESFVISTDIAPW